MLYLKHIPSPLRSYLLKWAGYLSIPGVKHTAEFYYWYTKLQQEGGSFQNNWYHQLMLNMAGEVNDRFTADKVIADFGCGPRGSLCWAANARQRIGIDVLVDKYRLLGIDKQNMTYVQSSENTIPLPDASVDILFTINALDHVDNLNVMCTELLRILKTTGQFIASFNLEEDASVCEPQTLTEEKLHDTLLGRLNVLSYRMAKRGPRDDTYRHFTDGSEIPTSGQRLLWVRAQKP
jgi:SAM-dependent methyltransferase